MEETEILMEEILYKIWKTDICKWDRGRKESEREIEVKIYKQRDKWKRATWKIDGGSTKQRGWDWGREI